MKTISKKIKTIYLLAMMAILSVCVAVFPVFKTDTAKAADEPGLSMTGASVQFAEKGKTDNFALVFEAKITKTLYDTIADKNATFGYSMYLLRIQIQLHHLRSQALGQRQQLFPQVVCKHMHYLCHLLTYYQVGHKM